MLKSWRSVLIISIRSKHKSTARRLSEKQLAKKYVDQKTITLFAGSGGNGMSTFLRDKLTEFGGPAGGDGGKGGDIYFIADENIKSLEKVQSIYQAESGTSGGNQNMTGKDGKDLYINIPVGTFFHLKDSLEVVADLQQHGETFLACNGGFGGKGNRFFVDSINTTPERCTPGTEGESLKLVAELRTIAHCGLVGFPNAGKSTLLRALTRANPAVAAYAFTTLVPHVGIIHYDDFVQIAVADTPGIIEGAHFNKGLGFRFLKHIEKCPFILYVIDMSKPEPWEQLYAIQNEFAHYNFKLNDRPYMILANKIDLPTAEENYDLFREEVEDIFPAENIFPVSGLKKFLIEDLMIEIRKLYDIVVQESSEQGKLLPKW